MRKFNFINLSVECWENIRRARKKLLFEALLKEDSVNEVYYFNPPLYRSKTFSREIKAVNGMHVGDRGLTFRGEKYSLVAAVNSWINFFEIKSILPPGRKWVSFFYNPKDVYLAAHLKKIGTAFFDWTEDWAVYHSDSSLNSYQKLALKKSDGVLVVTKALERLALEAGVPKEKVLYLPNATSWEPEKKLNYPDIFNEIPEPRIGYLGHLGPWFDKELVMKITRAQPSWNWVMVGHANPDIINYFMKQPNVYLIGQLKFDALQDYMSFCDILVAPYKKNFSGDATKLYDYIATGLPIVSTKVETALMLKAFISTASTVQSWINAIQKGLSEKNEKRRQSMRIECRRHTWGVRAATLLNWIKKNQGYG